MSQTAILKLSTSRPDAKLALLRLNGLRSLAAAERAKVEEAASQARIYRAGTEIVRQGESCTMQLLLKGWAAQTRMFNDGRRQLVRFLLPGDQFEYSHEAPHRAATSALALSDCAACPAPAASAGSSLALAYSLSDAEERNQLIDQVARLGRLTAAERTCDLLLELLERLGKVGLVENDGFEIPVTQELFSDALGLTPVHTNRTLQLCRQNGDIVWTSGRVRFPDASALAQRLGRRLATSEPFRLLNNKEQKAGRELVHPLRPAKSAAQS